MTVQDKIDLKAASTFRRRGRRVRHRGWRDGRRDDVRADGRGPKLRRPRAVHVGRLAGVGRLGEGIHQVAVQGQGIGSDTTEDSISGTFAPTLTSEQTLEGVQLACDMIRQRFELYTESVVAG